MAGTVHNNENDFHWTFTNVSLSFLVGVAVVSVLWLFAGLLLMLFLM